MEYVLSVKQAQKHETAKVLGTSSVEEPRSLKKCDPPPPPLPCHGSLQGVLPCSPSDPAGWPTATLHISSFTALPPASCVKGVERGGSCDSHSHSHSHSTPLLLYYEYTNTSRNITPSIVSSMGWTRLGLTELSQPQVLEVRVSKMASHAHRVKMIHSEDYEPRVNGAVFHIIWFSSLLP